MEKETKKVNYNYYDDDELDFTLITDTHFGRTFKDGVPLDRRGEYEEKIYEDFAKELDSSNKRIVIHAGDLFESPFVSNEVLMRVYEIIRKNNHPLNHYYFIAGNHDLSKDESKKYCTSFYILSKLLKNETNIHFIEDKPEIVEDGLLLVPYSHFKSADDLVKDGLNTKVKCIIGHFDDPTPAAVATFTGRKYSGHFHKKHLTQDGTLFIGSFYPIAFGEESDDSVMETMTLTEYNNRSEEELKDKRVRILLKEGEELPSEYSCLQLIGKKLGKEEDVDLEVKSDVDFDFRTLFMDCVKDSGIADELWNRYIRLKGND